MKLFGGSASVVLAERIGKALALPVFPVDQHIFPDGERRIRITEPVVGESVVIVQSACPPVDTNYMELFFLLDAIKRSGAEFISAVIPYFGYQRQDHIFRDGEAVSLEVIIRILESLGIDKLVSMDMHSNRIPALFTVPVVHVSAIPLFVEKINAMGWSNKETVLVSPDTGGIVRVEDSAKALDDMPYLVLDKIRDRETGVISIQSTVKGSAKGKKRAILLDDMISSGKTLVESADFLKSQGVEEIVAFATHPIFSAEAPKILQESVIAKVFVTDTVAIPEKKRFDKLEVLSAASILAQAVNQ